MGCIVVSVGRFAVTVFVEDQNSSLTPFGVGVGQEQLQPPAIDGLHVPGGLGDKVLEPLYLWVLGSIAGSSASQGGQSLITFSGE
jgi:hypothetical protein